MTWTDDARAIGAADPADHVARLAAADAALEAGDGRESYRLRAIAWQWAWAQTHGPAWRLCYVHGRGAAPMVAYFVPDETKASGPGWAERNYSAASGPPEGCCVRVLFESPGHVVPADLRPSRHLSAARVNARDCPWLVATSGWARLYAGTPNRCDLDVVGGDGVAPEVTVPDGARDVHAGCTVPRFCAEIERAGGWWLPMRG